MRRIRTARAVTRHNPARARASPLSAHPLILRADVQDQKALTSGLSQVTDCSGVLTASWLPMRKSSCTAYCCAVNGRDFPLETSARSAPITRNDRPSTLRGATQRVRLTSPEYGFGIGQLVGRRPDAEVRIMRHQRHRGRPQMHRLCDAHGAGQQPRKNCSSHWSGFLEVANVKRCHAYHEDRCPEPE